MTATKKPQNTLVSTLSADTLANVISSLRFVNDYFLHASETAMEIEKDVLHGLGQHLDQSIDALCYEKRKASQKLNKSGRQQNAKAAERALRALKNSVMDNSAKHTPFALNTLIRDSFYDLKNAQSEYYRAVETTGKDITMGDKPLPVFTQWLSDRSDHILHAIEVLGDDLRKTGRADDDNT